MEQIRRSSTFRCEKEILVKALQNNKELFRNLLKTNTWGNKREKKR